MQAATPGDAAEALARAESRRRRMGLTFAVLGAVAFSGKAIIAKLAYRYGVDAVTVLMYRMLFALPMFALMAWWASRGKPPFTRRDWMGIVLLGVTGYYLASFLDFAGLQYITASLERLILYLNPTIVLALSVLLFKKKVGARQLLAIAISYSGVLLVFGHEVSFQGSNTLLGGMLVFGSAVFYAVYLVYSGELVQRIGSLRLVGWATCVACLCCILQFPLLRTMSAAIVAPQVIWLSMLNAILCTAVPILLVMMAVERIGAPAAAQTGMIGPMATIFMGVLFLGEPFTAWILAGTVLVLVGIWLLTKWR